MICRVDFIRSNSIKCTSCNIQIPGLHSPHISISNVTMVCRKGWGVMYKFPLMSSALPQKAAIQAKLIGMTATETSIPLSSMKRHTLGCIGILVLRIKNAHLSTDRGVVEIGQGLWDVLQHSQGRTHCRLNFIIETSKGRSGCQGDKESDKDFGELHCCGWASDCVMRRSLGCGRAVGGVDMWEQGRERQGGEARDMDLCSVHRYLRPLPNPQPLVSAGESDVLFSA
jgi:hypothetical protein